MIVRILAGLLLYGCLYPSAQARDYRYSDAHLHYVDFFQETEGMPALLKAMDKAGVEQSMISGIPVAKKWHEDEPKRPRYYAGDDADAYWYSATDLYGRGPGKAGACAATAFPSVPYGLQPGGQERRQPHRTHARAVSRVVAGHRRSVHPPR
jgi:hypothetical protein